MKCIIHIGTEKTGSTTIQRFLRSNRKLLLDQGCLYPKSVGFENHQSFVFSFSGYKPEHQYFAERKIYDKNQYKIWEKTKKEHFLKELRSQDYRLKSVIISSEHFQSQLWEEENIFALKSFLENYFSDIQIIVYLRRQDLVATSRFSTALKAGRIPGKVFGEKNSDISNNLYNYEGGLERWSKVFGDSSIQPRLFSKKEMLRGNLIDDFASVADINIDGSVRSKSLNSSLSAKQMSALLEFNRNCTARLSFKRRKIRDLILLLFKVSRNDFKYYPSRHSAEDFYGQFVESNNRVAKKWFGRAKLFDYDFDQYPEHEIKLPALSFYETLLIKNLSAL